MTIFDFTNTARDAAIYDVDTQQKIMRVMSIDTDRNCVTTCTDPLEMAADGETVATIDLQYRSIYPIRGLGAFPSLFHCYGRIAK